MRAAFNLTLLYLQLTLDKIFSENGSEAIEKYKKKFKIIPNPEESEKGKKNFEKNIKKTFKEVLPQDVLDTLTEYKNPVQYSPIQFVSL